MACRTNMEASRVITHPMGPASEFPWAFVAQVSRVRRQASDRESIELFLVNYIMIVLISN